MPIIKSAIKRVKQSEKRRVRNVVPKRQLRSSIRELEAAIDAKDTKGSQKLLDQLFSSLDISVKKNLIHKNKAARKKSYYSALVKGISSRATKKPAKKTAATKTPTKSTKK